MLERQTQSLCPVCLQVVDAAYVRDGDDVSLHKTCADHGSFEAVVWRGPPAFSSWSRTKTPVPFHNAPRRAAQGCPHDCGLCTNHRQHTCSALIEVTQACDLGCPVCYADSDGGHCGEPDLARVAFLLDCLKEQSGDCAVQLSGGEPTLRDDLLAIISLCKAKGFSFVQINTNGLRLAEDPGYAKHLREAGTDTIYLQCDGVDNSVYEALRGRPLWREKQQAVANALTARLGVVLVATVVPGVNEPQLGDLLRFALAQGPGVRGLHLQPVSYFGRVLTPPTDAMRITLPELMRALEAQTDGMVRADHCIPPGCEHALCSFHVTYHRTNDGSLHPISSPACCGEAATPAAEGASKSKAFTRRLWVYPSTPSLQENAQGAAAALSLGDMDVFLQNATRRSFTLSAMAFQDAWTMDLDRVQGCCIHVVVPDGRLVPFCAYNVTNASGRPLHRGVTGVPS